MSNFNIDKLTVSLGYYNTEQNVADKRIPQDKRILKFHNAMNVVSTIISPLGGLIRMIGAIAFIILNKSAQQQGKSNIEWNKDSVTFLKHELFRGALEILGLGIPLAVADGVMALRANEKLCFKKA
jgi:hypothetical protein